MDERDALVESFLGKREKAQEEANQHRAYRDDLNDNTRAHARRRDELNAQVRALVDEANSHRAKRDALNAQVREGKDQRDTLNKEAQEKSQQLAALRQERGGAQGPPLHKLKAELKRLEYEHQTKALSPKKEKELIELMATRQREIRERESEHQESAEVQQAYDAMREAKARAEEQHKLVTQLAQEAQTEHEAMVRLFGEADGLRKEADAAQAAFVESKVKADQEHRAYIDTIQRMRDLDRVTGALRGPGGAGGMAHGGPSRGDQARADQVFERFKKGEKLSTEDLMTLQKAGRL